MTRLFAAPLARAAVLAPLTVLLACRHDAAAPGTEPLSQAEAMAIGRDVAGEVMGMTRLIAVSGGVALGALGLDGRFPGGFHPRPGFRCATLDPFPPSDSDLDGVPDQLLISFELPACSFTNRRGATLELTGSVLITDPSTTAFGFQLDITDLQEKLIGPDGAFRLRRLNGLLRVLRSATDASLVDQTSAEVESSGGFSARLDKDWTITFVADPGQASAGLHGLPSGKLAINGSTTWTRGETSHSLSITTVAALHFDATCDAEQQFDAGVLRITKVHPNRSLTIRVEFTGCGEEPVVTVEPPRA